MLFTTDVIERLIEEACDICHHTYTCRSDDELTETYCSACYFNRLNEFIRMVTEDE